ncbi:MAG TPA: GNAT family N-acetyltransferase [Dysgonamonadaceae bacterium]|nr:GNAT family N-acetyltransferase [Dysgonamonadaceae bacterium]
MDVLLKNKTLFLRAPEPEDLDVLYKWENDTDVWRYGSAISPYSKYALKQYIAEAETDIFQSKQLRFMIVLQKAKTTVGTIDLYDFDALNSRCGVGVYIDPEWRKKGYANAALSLLENYSFSFLKINQLYAIIPQNNEDSLRLFRNSGFSQSGVLKQWISTESAYKDAFIVQKLNSNYYE